MRISGMAVAACLFLLAGLQAQDAAAAPSLEARLLAGADTAVLAEVLNRLDAGPQTADLLELGLAAARNLGRFPEEERLAKALHALETNAARGRIALARYLSDRGQRPAAIALLEPLSKSSSSPPDKPAFSMPGVAALAELHASLGHGPLAEALWDQLVEEAQRVVVREAEDLVALAQAYVAFEGIKEAEAALIEAQKAIDGARKGGGERSALNDWRPTAALAELYQSSMHLDADAVKECENALLVRKDLAEVLALKGRAELSWQKHEDAEASLRRALAVNAHERTAHAELLRQQVGAQFSDAASAELDQALTRFPTHASYLGLDLARAFFTQGERAFQKRLAEVHEVLPNNDLPLLILVDLLSDQRRWQEALALAEQGVTRFPHAPRMHDAVARLSLYLGEDARARAALKAASEAERFSHVKRNNMAEFLRVVGKFYDDAPTEHLLLRLARRERAVLEPVIGPFAERSFAQLAQKYAFTPLGIGGREKLRIEVLLSSGDLSARTFALPRVGFLGFCFGPLVTMLSPGAEGSENFSWARTLHHELAHSFALGLSKGRVPKWLTEGLSTYEESAANAAWDRHLDCDLQDALHSDELIPVESLDAAFGTPRAVFAYYQSGLLVGAMVKKAGMAPMLALLRSLGEDVPFAIALKAHFHMDLQELNALLKDAASEHCASIQRIPRLVGKALAAATKADAKPDALTLVRLLATYQDARKLNEAAQVLKQLTAALGEDEPRVLFLSARQAAKSRDEAQALKLVKRALEAGLQDVDAFVLLARLHMNAGDAAASKDAWKAAIGAFPRNADREGPRRKLSELLVAKGATDEAIAVLEGHLAIDAEDDEARLQILKLFLVKGEHGKILAHAEARLLTRPLVAEVHLQRGRALRQLARPADAESAVRIGLACKMPVSDEADLLAELGLVLLDLQRPDEALECAKKADALVPGHAIAKDVRRRAGAR
jgi:lipopolysaccharide biosynthesis regulator YciM